MWLVCLGYAIGSIPFAFLLARRWGRVDVRQAGSGNVGAANVFRTTGRSLGLAVMLLDLAKGSAVVLLADRLGAGDSVRTATGVAAVVGHVFPVWLRFRGGKGVATTCGVFVLLAPLATAVALGGFVITLLISRYVSLASVIAAVLLPSMAYTTRAPAAVLAGVGIVTGLVLFRHRANLARLRAGTERRLGQRA
jgi:glycerol-3-phosphate acyltransferase PlsY